MKITQINRKQGVVKILVENLDDLWYLSSVLRPGDRVRTKTERRIKSKDDVSRSKTGQRKVITLTVQVEKADFSAQADVFRVTGVIEEGPEDLISIGSYHTFNVDSGTALTILKSIWSNTDLDLLREAENASLRPKILIVVVDDGDAAFGLVRESRIDYYDINRAIGGKYDLQGRRSRKMEFYSEVAGFINEINSRENISAVIIAGAGFEKEHFLDFLSSRFPDLRKKTLVENIGSYGRNGIQEVMKRSGASKVVLDITAARDLNLVSGLLREIGKDTGLGVYGIADVESAGLVGNLKNLLVCDDLFLRERSKIEGMIETVKSFKGSFHLINHDTDAGKQLCALGGIGGILRYPLAKQ